MKELRLETLLAVLEEMFGPVLFWAMVAAALAALLAIVVVVIRDRGLRARRLARAELISPLGGVAAVAFVLTTSGSRPGDVGGPVDWLAMLGVFAAGAAATLAVVYLACAAVQRRREA